MSALEALFGLTQPFQVLTNEAGEEWLLMQRSVNVEDPDVRVLTVTLVRAGSEHDPRIRYRDLLPGGPS